MKRLTIVLAFLMNFFALQAQKKFEGYVTYRFSLAKAFITDTAKNVTLKVDNLVLNDGKDTNLILKSTYKDNFIVSETFTKDSSSLVSYYNFDKLDFMTYCNSEHCKKLSLKNINYNNYKIIRTNEQKKIAGYQCEKYLVQKVNATTKKIMTQQIWVTQEINHIQNFPLFDLLYAIEDSFLWFYPSIKGFPVRIEFPFCLEKPELEAFGINPCEILAFAWQLEKITPQKISLKEVTEKIEKLKKRANEK